MAAIPESVSQAISERRTVKVIAENDLPQTDSTVTRAEIDSLLDIAGWAPFHQPSHVAHRSGELKEIIEPWRVYKFDAPLCRKVAADISPEDNPGIIPGMLKAADCLLNVTWLPDPGSEYTAPEFAPTERNMEHIAAASAFVQNILVAATAKNITTYWSSGGVFKTEKYKTLYGIPEQEILLGSIFLFPDNADDCEHRVGKLRDKRHGATGWSRWVEA